MSNDLARLVFSYDVEVCKEFVDRLRAYRYELIQFIPARRSRLAFATEHRNLLNLVLPRQHLLFYPSVFPGLYESLLALNGRKLQLCFRACFLNESVPDDKLRECFGNDLIDRALASKILVPANRGLEFTVRFVPFKSRILLSDPHYTYPPYENGRRKFVGRIWMGADSFIFAQFLGEFLKRKKFKAALDVGSGSGIVAMTAAPFAERCVAIDCNERAVQFTRMNAQLNGIANVVPCYSNLFEHVNERFDLIVANPWYCDLASGGLEEVPGLVAGLREHLTDNGLCILLMNSYVKSGKDTVFDFLGDFARREKYDLEIQTIGYNFDVERAADWRRHGISYSVYSHMILKKTGSGVIRKRDAGWARRLRDHSYIKACQAVQAWSTPA